MKHYYQLTEGWFNYTELYSDMVKKFPTNSHFVEIGTWQGTSAVYMGVEIVNSGKKIKFDCIDPWKDLNDGYDYVGSFDKFLQNIKPLSSVINYHKLESVEASKLYKDESLDFVFIDGAHDYDNVKNDVNAWYPKVKNGGIIAGHDYTIPSPVQQAVDEFFMNKGIYLLKNCWIFNKVN